LNRRGNREGRDLFLKAVAAFLDEAKVAPHGFQDLRPHQQVPPTCTVAFKLEEAFLRLENETHALVKVAVYLGDGR